MSKTPSVSDIEMDLVRVLCRQPSYISRVDREMVEDVTPGGVAQKILYGIFALYDSRKPLTLQSIAEQTDTPIAQLKQLDSECSRQLLTDWESNLPIIRLYGLRRRFDEFARTWHKRMTTASVLEAEEIYEEAKLAFDDVYRPGNDLGPVDLHDIAIEYYSKPKQKVSWSILTGYLWLDLVSGGIRQNELWLVQGQYGTGKTQFTRSMLWNMANNGVYVDHFAHDGGNRFRHMQYYVAMQAQQNLIATGLPLKGQGRLPDGTWGEIPYITIDTCETIIRAIIEDEPLPIPFPQHVIDCVADAWDKVSTNQIGQKGGRLRILDAKIVRHSIPRLVTLLEREYASGARLFAFDHGGELGDPGRMSIFERSAVAAQTVTNFIREHDIAGVVLSQVNRNQESRGGDEWNIKCDSRLDIVRADPENDESQLKLTVGKGRFMASGKNVSMLLKPYFASGLLIEDRLKEQPQPEPVPTQEVMYDYADVGED